MFRNRFLSLFLITFLVITLVSNGTYANTHIESLNLEKYDAVGIYGNPIGDSIDPQDSGWMYTTGTGRRPVRTHNKTYGYFETRGKWRCSFNQNVSSYTYDYMRISSSLDYVWLEREVTGAYKPAPDIAMLTLTGRVLDPVFQVSAVTHHVYHFYGNGKWSRTFYD